MTIFICVLLVMLLATVVLFVKNVNLSRKLSELACNDTLTGIINRRCFMEYCQIQIERLLRTGGECFVIIFDLDHFKHVNDNYGHLAGDKVLREIAQRVKKSMRAYDLLARYGGEEFIILMADIGKADVMQAAERIRLDVCGAPVEFESREIPISASFGVARATPENDMNTAIKYADEALYMAKNEGRNRVVFYRQQDVFADPANEH